MTLLRRIVKFLVTAIKSTTGSSSGVSESLQGMGHSSRHHCDLPGLLLSRPACLSGVRRVEERLTSVGLCPCSQTQ